MSQLPAFFTSATLKEWAKAASRLVIVTGAVLALSVGAVVALKPAFGKSWRDEGN